MCQMVWNRSKSDEVNASCGGSSKSLRPEQHIEHLGQFGGENKNKPMCYPQQLFKILECFCTGTLRNFVCYVYRNLPEPHPLSAPQPSEPHQLSGPEPSGTSSALCTGTLRNLISHLHRNRPEPHQLSAPEPFGTSSAFCTGTLRNLLRNLGLQLHRIAPKLFWAKDPIASFAVGEKTPRDAKYFSNQQVEQMRFFFGGVASLR